ncbi:Protein FMP21 mitochondrial [Ceratocystis lukuohia]|uniref:Succinate dehydrogenase assembly factor 4, mitochondrial n=1 Tax=Ceratocystis lukuohia TaxID=2019550 RepID=A0ABR4MUT3_9PEZI
MLHIRQTLAPLCRNLRLPTPTFTFARPASSLRPSPGPPRLPAAEQAEFERLQRLAASALTNPNSVSAAEALAEATGGAGVASSTTSSSAPSASSSSSPSSAVSSSAAAPSPDLEEGGLFRGAKPEFDGDRNPATGEVGGPKNEPLRWGSKSDWSFNGRATDF